MPFIVGEVVECNEVPGKDRLRACKVNVGDPSQPLSIVTTAPNVRLGTRCIVATVDTEIDVNGECEKVKRATVGGVVSEGMLCDSKMLGWAGGAAGVAAHLPDSFAIGSVAPKSKPRLDGQAEPEAPAAEMSDKERKASEKLLRKQQLAEKKAARKAAKSAGFSGDTNDENDNDDNDDTVDVGGLRL